MHIPDTDMTRFRVMVSSFSSDASRALCAGARLTPRYVSLRLSFLSDIYIGLNILGSR